jgi:hypothetical protein
VYRSYRNQYTSLSTPTAATIVTENENIHPTHSEEPAQETSHHIYGYEQFQAFHQDHVHGRQGNVEIQGPTSSQQTTAPSLVLADYLLGDEAFSDLRTFPTRSPTHPVLVSELESTTAHATTLAAPFQASSPKSIRAKRNAPNESTQLLTNLQNRQYSSIENTEDATTHPLPQRKRLCTQAISNATISARSTPVHSSAPSNTPREEVTSAIDIYNAPQDLLLTAFHMCPEAGQMWNGPAPFSLHTTPLAFHPRTESMILSKYVEDPISRMSETPDDKTFIHYKIPTVPVSENCYSTESLKSLPDNATVSDIQRRLNLNNDTHSWLLVRVSSSV